MIHVYMMPGMAASPRIFEHIKLPEEEYTIHLMDWLAPLSVKESMHSYCERLSMTLKHEDVVLIGVSFGAVIVQELSRMVNARKVIVISSVKSTAEFPRRMRLSRATQLHKILPTGLLKYVDFLAKYASMVAPKKTALYKQYLNVVDPIYMKWALDTLINWQSKEISTPLAHIHGDADPVFPVKYIDDYIQVPGGTHVMIIHRYRWFNENLPQIIAN
ncbi:alpha/beta hydrolase [Nonlabens ponticola]|uniref:Alpha/beta hydrolase n=1 Tax=Nonlabens ponticola TaxID=2496866 RepID=A0A3S9MZQ3_9FLAO|nr:alpha/beta hydrolase [Nonlabens ponticola]AZQ44619.1 alpha/beta hydrolase [Nonlabens ponticola]